MSNHAIRIIVTVSIMPFWCVNAETNLLSELQQKSELQGLALARVRGNVVDVIPFGSEPTQCVWGDTGVILTGFSSDGFKVIFMDYHENVKIRRIDGTLLRATSALQFPNVVSWLSPRGDHLLFSSSHNSSALPGNGLYLADLVSNQVQMIEPEAPHAGLASGFSKSAGWSRDGQSIVYAHEQAIFKLDLGTRKKLQLARGTSPSWSPDGEWIAYQADDG